MKYLVHCIFKKDANAPLPALAPELSVLEQGGLAAAVTPWPEPAPKLDAPRLVAYQRAVAGIHASRSVIPLRFGCIAADASRVLDLLRERGAEFERLLAQWENLTEMGLRVWYSSRPRNENRTGATEIGQYLEALRSRYPALTAVDRELIAHITQLLGGLYQDQRVEARPAADVRLVSMNFLVPRDFVDLFREKARKIGLPGDKKLLVSGPWPPYSFAVQFPK